MLRLLASIFALPGVASAQGAEEHFSLGSWEVVAPAGWREGKKKEDLLVLRSPDTNQQATITILRFGKELSFDDFKKLCDKRVEAERRVLADGFIEPSPPFKDGSNFGMFFSGGDKKTGRLFSGYVALSKTDLGTLYVEGIGTGPKDHLATFKEFVRGFKRK
jgi:hypothetical protein